MGNHKEIYFLVVVISATKISTRVKITKIVGTQNLMGPANKFFIRKILFRVFLPHKPLFHKIDNSFIYSFFTKIDRQREDVGKKLPRF